MARVVIYDSGVGGLSIHAAIKKTSPHLQCVFVSDNAAYPYGTKNAEFLLQRIKKCTESVAQQLTPDLLVVACNTASTLALDALRCKYHFPIVGVVPAIKPASLQSQSKKIALLATPATIAHSYTKSLIDDFANDCEVLKVGSSHLVDIAEQKLCGESVDMKQIKQVLAPILSFDQCDKLVLACTHFPLLNKEIELVLKTNSKNNIDLIDSSEAIARRVSALLKNTNNESEQYFSSSLTTHQISEQPGLLAEFEERGLPYKGVLKVENIE